MLASITPLGERGRQSHWSVTVTAFAISAATAGAGAGALLGLLGSPLARGLSGQGAALVLAAAVLAALVLDLAPARVPGPRRQVNERWLDEFRGWVYGAGFGAQLGLGLTTVVSSAATYVVVVASLLSGGAARGAVIFGLYGLVRGVTPLFAARVRRPEQLVALLAGLERRRGWAARGSGLALAAILGATVLAALS